LVRELQAAVVHPSPSAATARRLLTLITQEVAQGAWSSTPVERGRDIVAESLQYIERRCLEPLSLDRLGRDIGRSPAYLTAALKRATGRSAGWWITAGRMAEARRRLRYSMDTIGTIAKHVGYADPTHFIRVFQRMHGSTPAIWRRSHDRPAANHDPSASADL
jgi:AraC-like DNA-binding protein